MKRFLIFRAGVNRTTKGSFLFDKKAAASVMDHYTRHGVDVMIDLEHLSIDAKAPNYDPDARGWCKLELDARGNLWAVAVKWTSDGARRLAEKLQRYISPAFLHDKQGATPRIVRLFNIALVGMPATDEIPALVAASRSFTPSGLLGLTTLNVRIETMDLAKMIREKLGLPPEATDEDVMAALEALVEAATAKASEEETEEETETSEGGGDEPPAKTETASDTVTPEEIAALPPKVQAKVMALSARASKAKPGKSKTQEVSDFIAANAAAFTPVTEKWARSQTIETLSDYVSQVGEAHAPPAAERRRTAAKSEEDVDTMTLSDEELEVVALTGISEEMFLNQKKQEATAARLRGSKKGRE
jgi:phage I-like protein